MFAHRIISEFSPSLGVMNTISSGLRSFFVTSISRIQIPPHLQKSLLKQRHVSDFRVLLSIVPIARKMPFHRLVRALNRRTLIYFEYTDRNIAFDNLEDPLPYDIESNRFVVHDRDFALWFRDTSDDPEKYSGKIVTIRALIVQDERLPKHTVAVGREVMTCCAADIQFCCMAAHTKSVFPQPQQWAVITARILVKKHLFRQQVVPELEILAATPADPPEEAVAAFY